MSSPNTNSFDYAVIGAGSGGLASARRAASHGASVCIIENFRIGGTCVNLGCVPKKMMFYASELLHKISKVSKYYSIHSSQATAENLTPEINWSQFVENRNSSVSRLNKIFHSHLEKSGVTFFDSTATLSSNSNSNSDSDNNYNSDNRNKYFIELEDGRRIESRHILIATGSSATTPAFKGAITSDEVFREMKERPERIVIVGAGYIGVELACAMRGMGVEVDLIVRSNILGGFDSLIKEGVLENMRNMGINVRLKSSVVNYDKKEKRVEIKSSKSKEESSIEAGEVIEKVDYLLYAIGRRPNLKFIGNIEGEAKERIIRKGKVEVDNFRSVDLRGNVWAVGDVTGETMLTPYAIKCGRFLADRLFRDNVTEFSFEALEYIPTVVFSSPPAGTVGLTEEEARGKFAEVEVRTAKFDGMFYDVPKMAGIGRENVQGSRIKVVVDKKSDKVVGIHLVGHFADEALQGFALSMCAGVEFKHFDRCLAIHPTTAEDVILI